MLTEPMKEGWTKGLREPEQIASMRDAAPDMYEALKPFAAMADAGDQRPSDDAVWAGQDGLRLTYGDFRRARAALQKARGQ